MLGYQQSINLMQQRLNFADCLGDVVLKKQNVSGLLVRFIVLLRGLFIWMDIAGGPEGVVEVLTARFKRGSCSSSVISKAKCIICRCNRGGGDCSK